jgi:hypothetical protein
MDFEHEAAPDAGEGVRTERGAVKEIQEAAVTAGAQAQAAHEAGDARQILAGAQAGQDDDQPVKGAEARTRRTQLRHD